MDLQQLRERYPFRPYQLALLDGQMLVEVISYPWPDAFGNGGAVYINVRTVPGDPSTMREVAATRLTHSVTLAHPDPVDAAEALRKCTGAVTVTVTEVTGPVRHVTGPSIPGIRKIACTRCGLEGTVAGVPCPRCNDPEPVDSEAEVDAYIRAQTGDDGNLLHPNYGAPVDPDSVDGLIARLQALPPDVRKLRVYIVGQSDELYKVNPEVTTAEVYGWGELEDQDKDPTEKVVVL